MVGKLKNNNTLPIRDLSSFEDIFLSFQKREDKKYFVDLFDTHLNKKSLLYICCSWWPDSMFLAFLLIRYRHIVKWLPLSITKFIHINHNTSLSDELLEKVVIKNFVWLFDIKKICFEKWGYTESVLRKKRWVFYKECIQETPLWQDVYLCLWHNLTDRIENSFLHFDRGTQIPWIVNMQLVQKKTLFYWKSIKTYTCFRPLLTFPKKSITSLCDRFGIGYENDVHNNDISQQRIQYRKKIEKLSIKDQKVFYEEWKFVYTTLEEKNSDEIVLQPLFYPAFWGLDWLYKTQLPDSVRQLIKLLTTLGLYTNISKPRLEEMMKWFTKKQWSLNLSWWRFLCAYGQLYLAKKWDTEKFREKYNTTSLYVKECGKSYLIAWYERYIDTKLEDWTELTFTGMWDRIWSIPYMKRAAKKHIPFFRRRALPILKRNGKILEVLPSVLWPWQK